MSQEYKTMERELREELPRILKYWEQVSWDPQGQYYRTLGCDNRPLADGRRKTVLAARVLWAYSAAYRFTGNARDLQMARQAFRDLKEHYVDLEYGGLYECLDQAGTPLDCDKIIYTQSYGIYGLSEYYLASGEAESLELAGEIYRLIRTHAYDETLSGYRTAFDRQWKQIPGNLTMDTHLHLVEACANLHKAAPSEELRLCLKELVTILTGRFLREDGALYQELCGDWTPAKDLSDRFADESECSWMLAEAAWQIGEAAFTKETEAAILRMMEHVYEKGCDRAYGGVYDRYNPVDGSMSTDKMWWEESESVIGFLYAYRISGEEKFKKQALDIWKFIASYICNPTEEWNWKVQRNGTRVPVADPSDPLKCPYHNVRLTVLAVPLL